nr:MAG: maturation protein [Guiyang fiers-like virus 1]
MRSYDSVDGRVRRTRPKGLLASPTNYGVSDATSEMGSTRIISAKNISQNLFGLETTVLATLMNKSLDDFYEQCGESNAIAVNWLQRKDSIDMIANSVTSLITIARQLKNRDPRLLRKIKRYWARRGHPRELAEDFSGLWLQYFFGWAPLVSDIEDQIAFLRNPFPSQFVKGKAKVVIEEHSLAPYSDYFGYYEGFRFQNIIARTSVCALVSVNDTNAVTNAHVNTNNLTGVVWELIPFSWAIDYFVDVGGYLRNMNPDFPGLKIEGAYRTIKSSGYWRYVWYKGDQLVPYRRRPNAYVDDSGSFSVYRRMTGLPSFQLAVNYGPLSIMRVSYLIATLTQILRTAR